MSVKSVKYEDISSIESMIKKLKIKKESIRHKRILSQKGKEDEVGLDMRTISREEHEISDELKKLRAAKQYRLKVIEKEKMEAKNRKKK